MLIENLKSEYLEYVKCFKSKGTYKFYDHHLKVILEYLNVKKTRQIKKKDIMNYISLSQHQGLSNKTINYRILSLKTMLRYAKIEKHSIYDIPKLKTKDYRYNCLDKKQLNMLVNYILYSNIKTNNKLILSLLLETGIRLNELINIKTCNIDRVNRSIYLDTTKNGIDRVVLYSDLTDRFLDDFTDGEYLISLKHKGVYAIFERVKAKLGFSVFHPHMLRHTYATVLVENNTNLEFLRITLGHKNLKTTQRYMHLNTEVMRKIYDHSFKY